jgi:hypothetical protein
MARSIDVRKTVYENSKYREVVDTQFSSFGTGATGELPISIPEFFRFYEDLYLDIPLTGNNSHTFLINRSSELVNVDTENAEVSLLFEEINDLREQVAQQSAKIAELTEGSVQALELEQQVGTLENQLQEIRDISAQDESKRRRFEQIEEFLNRSGV